MMLASDSPASNLSRVPLAQLVQQIGEIIALGAAEDDNDGGIGTQNQQQDARNRLRGILLQLIDVAVSNSSAGSRELLAVLELLELTLDKVPNWLAGDSSAVLLHIVDRFVMILMRCSNKTMVEKSAVCMAKVLKKMHQVDVWSYERCVMMLCSTLMDEVCQVAVVLYETGRPGSSRLDLSKCFVSSSVASPSGKKPPQSISVDGKGCERIISGVISTCTQLGRRISTSLQMCGGIVFGKTLHLMLSASQLVQSVCLEYLELYLRSSVVLEEQCRMVLRQCDCLVAQKMSVIHSEGSLVDLHTRLAAIVWVIWSRLGEFLEDNTGSITRVQVLETLESCIMRLSSTSNAVSGMRAWVQTFAECVADAPELGVQRSSVFRIMSKFDLESYKSLLQSAFVVLSVYPKEDVSLLIGVLHSACLESCRNRRLQARDGGVSSSHKKKKQRTSDGGLSSPIRKVDDGSLGSSQSPSSQVSWPSLRKVFRGILDSLYLESDGIIDCFASSSKKDVGESLQTIALSVSFVACLNRDSAAECAAAIIDDFQSRQILDDLAKSYSYYIILLIGVISDLYVKNMWSASLGNCLAKCSACMKYCPSKDVGALALFNDTLRGNFAASVENVQIKKDGMHGEMIHFIPVIALMLCEQGSKPDRRAKKKSDIAMDAARFIVAVSDVSDDMCYKVVLGLLLYLRKWPDMHAVFDLARQAIVLDNPGGLGKALSGDYSKLQPKISRAISQILYSIAQKENKSDELAALLICTSMLGIERASATDSDEWRGLARYILTALQGRGIISRAFFSCIPVITRENFILAVTLPKEHPINSKDRSSATHHGENEVVKLIKSALPNSIEKVYIFENVLSSLLYCTIAMRNVNAVNLCQTILIFHLESKDPVISSLAAHCLFGIAKAQGRPLKDILLQNQPLLEILGPCLPRKVDLLDELADLLDMSTKDLLAACMSTIFPAICEKGGTAEISTLSKQLGISPKQLLLQYGHYPLTSALMNGIPTMNTFVEIVEEITGDDFMHMASSITPRTLSELILQTGSSNAWNSCQGILPDSLVEHISQHIALIISKSGEKSSDTNMDVSALLAEGDHTTRMLKQLGDMLEAYLAKEGSAADFHRSRGPLKVVRGVIFLIRLTGRFVGRFLPQFLVLLSASIRPANPADVRVQGLIGWTYLVRSLTSDAPLQLGSVANQIVVALLDCLQEEGPVGTAAFAALEVLIEACRKLFPEKLHSLPPIPQSSPELKKMSESLQEQSRVATVDEKVRSLLEGLKDESLDVRVVTLRELRSLFLSQRQWLISISSSTAKVEDASLLRDLISALIMSSEPEASSKVSLTARNLCAECLGMIGAIDPSRIKINFSFESTRHRTITELAKHTMVNYLTKLLKTAPNMQRLDFTTLAIQDVLRCDALNVDRKRASRSKRSTLFFDSLPEETQAIVRPYLDSRYSVTSATKKPQSIIYQPNMQFIVWFGRWLIKLVDDCGPGSTVSFFKAVSPVIRFDASTGMMLAPYIILSYLDHKGKQAKSSIVEEFLRVFKENERPSRDGVLCMQAIFSMLDTLHLWLEESKAGATDKEASKDDFLGSFDWKILYELIESIPRVQLAHAASKCGAHARALLYFETHLRLISGGGANIAAASSAKFSDEYVGLLLEIYGELEEPDGLDGIMKLRQGPSKLEDQRLAAEKNGSWAEASSLYELDISKSNDSIGSDSNLLEGRLNCLLQLGHFEGLVNQVRGLLSRDNTLSNLENARIATKGVASLWRLGKYRGEIQKYIGISQEAFQRLTLDEKWELSLGQLLCHLSEDAGHHRLREDLSKVRFEVMSQFSAAAKESYARAYPYLVKLHMIQEISDAAGIINSTIGPKERQRNLRWRDRLSITQPTVGTRGPILDIRRQLAHLMDARDEVGFCWMTHASLCRETGNLDAAVPSVLESRNLKVPGSSLEHLELLHAKGNTYRALQELQGIVPILQSNQNEIEIFDSKKEKSDYLCQILLKEAQWTAELGQGTREEVVHMFERALSMHNDPDRWETGFFRFALYLDEYMSDAKERQTSLENRGRVVSDRLGGKSRVKLSQDRPYHTYYPEVIEAYGKCAMAGTEYIYQSLPRLLTLWFEIGSDALKCKSDSAIDRAQAQVMSILHDLSKRIPIHCWMTSLPQLISRICHNNPDVAAVTRSLITDAATAYPQQVLWALAGVSKSGRSNRRNAAMMIINSAKRRSSEQQRRLFAENNLICEQLYKLCHYTPAANARVISAKKSFSHLTRVMPLGVMMPTMESLNMFQTLDGYREKQGTYDESLVVTIAGMKDSIDVMMSLMKPKRVIFIGSDGKEYPFLAKPKDDLRKDNRMMEAAGIINRLFKDDPDARRKDLYLRRFAVIPITEDCGLVEWVCSTKPVRSCISEVFSDSPSHIKRINHEIKNLYNNATASSGKDARSKSSGLMSWLDAVLRTYPPCFHRWFLKHYPEPASWLNARLAFTRTYSVWCVVGHVVGLGDRHLENVLLDMSNGDAIQIDFGCLFDKGLTLPQPEVVPFRLTQNIIDAFGVSGVEGVYRNSFENTLAILRKHRGNILSIMDTFVHDPLVDWAKSEERRSTSSGDKEADNPQARDWLDTISGRLQGTLLGVTSEPCMPLSIQGQTQRLIQEATSMENLSRMYIWWQAWY